MVGYVGFSTVYTRHPYHQLQTKIDFSTIHKLPLYATLSNSHDQL